MRIEKVMEYENVYKVMEFKNDSKVTEFENYSQKSWNVKFTLKSHEKIVRMEKSHGI